MNNLRNILVGSLLTLLAVLPASGREKQNFNGGWLLFVGDTAQAAQPAFDDSQWQPVTLPRAFNEDEAFARDIAELTDTIMWYRKHFSVDNTAGKKFFIEFEGVRQAGEFWLNGHRLGLSNNGVMACGFDLTPYIVEGENVMAVRIDNSWTYHDPIHESRFQWNDRNFNANYGGIPKNVWLHITGKLYQTLPLYSNLGTTGTYVYATDIDVAQRSAVVHVESQVRNEDSKPRTFRLFAKLVSPTNHIYAFMSGESVTLQPGETRVVSIESKQTGLRLWSWGYGYLYTVYTYLVDGDKADPHPLKKEEDMVATRTGFRKTRFGEGKIWLNDRVLMVHGYAQRTSNEWPAVGISVPAWMSDYSNRLMVESGGNLVRWMHVTPWKQDIESCDRVGLLQAMPAGDAEKDVEGARWQQRLELMRDAIIYNRNNPSIVFYECGNKGISREHMLQMKQLRDQYDPHGGRAIGSREMLDIDEAEYGGEMLYINKSGKHPVWAMEYCRDEGMRRYWDQWTPPYHPEGEGPLYRGKPAREYNHNQDQMAIEMVRRWYDYWTERPGTGRRVSSGGVKIVFSDTNTHHRGESNYRTSGVVDAMRLPKDAFYAHQVMWTGWVDDEQPRTHILGHWNYEPGTRKPVYVVSNGTDVELLLNGRSLGKGRPMYRYLYVFDDVSFEPGTLRAVADAGGNTSSHELQTAGQPHHLLLTAIENPQGFKADGADMAIVQVEVVDEQGRRCPVDNRDIHFTLTGEGEWRGGLAGSKDPSVQQADDTPREGLLDAAATKNVSDNYVLSTTLPVECGVNRALVRSTVTPGDIHVYASAEGLDGVAHLTLTTQSVDPNEEAPAITLPCNLSRGETFPPSPSYTETMRTIDIVSADVSPSGSASLAASPQAPSANPSLAFDDNEVTEWQSDGSPDNAWIAFNLKEAAPISDISLKLTGWRTRCYPLAVYAYPKGSRGKAVKVWEGITPASLGYVHLRIDKPVKSSRYMVKMLGPAQDAESIGDMNELAGGAANVLDRVKTQSGAVTLRIVEADFCAPR